MGLFAECDDGVSISVLMLVLLVCNAWLVEMKCVWFISQGYTRIQTPTLDIPHCLNTCICSPRQSASLFGSLQSTNFTKHAWRTLKRLPKSCCKQQAETIQNHVIRAQQTHRIIPSVRQLLVPRLNAMVKNRFRYL